MGISMIGIRTKGIIHSNDGAADNQCFEHRFALGF